MPANKLAHTESFIAGGDLRLVQYYFVKMSADRTCVVGAAITDIPIGVLQNNPNTGEEALVTVIGRTKVIAIETLTAGELIGCGGDGRAYLVEAGDTTVYRAGQVIVGSAGAGSVSEAIISCTGLNVAP